MKILCIMPCYNAESTLGSAIKSVIAQDYTNWELIIVDDASTDKSYKIAKSYAKKHSNITVLKNHTNQGCYYSRNRALYYMKDKEWDVFTVHDADDTSTFDRFKIYINTFLAHPKLSYIMGVFHGKRQEAAENKVTYKAQARGSGISWYKRDLFITFGYFFPTRFSGDTEYIERVREYLSRLDIPGKTVAEITKEVTSSLGLKHCYTYETGFHTQGGLTQKYKMNLRESFKDYYNYLFKNYYKEKEDFYMGFSPSSQDLL